MTKASRPAKRREIAEKKPLTVKQVRDFFKRYEKYKASLPKSEIGSFRDIAMDSLTVAMLRHLGAPPAVTMPITFNIAAKMLKRYMPHLEKACAKELTAKRRREIARQAAAARWPEGGK